MTGEFRFLLDEHIHNGVADELARMGFDAIHVREIGMLGGTDTQILKQAIEDRRIVVTRDVRDFIKLVRYVIQQGKDTPGVLLVPSSITQLHPGPLARAIQIWSNSHVSSDREFRGITWLTAQSREDDSSGFVRESEPAYVRVLRRLEATV